MPPGRDGKGGEKQRVRGTLVFAIMLLCCIVLVSLLYVSLPSSDGNLANFRRGDFSSRRPAAAAAIRAGQHIADNKKQHASEHEVYNVAGRGPDGRYGKIAIAAAYDPNNKANANGARPPKGMWSASRGKYSSKYKHAAGPSGASRSTNAKGFAAKMGAEAKEYGQLGSRIKSVAEEGAFQKGGDLSGMSLAGGLLTKAIKMLKSTVHVGAPNTERSEQGFHVVGGIPVTSKAGQEQRLETGQPAMNLTAVRGPRSNACKDSCPRFLSYAISIKDADGKPARGTEIEQFVEFSFDSSADVLKGAIHMAAIGLASSHACFKLTVYTDLDEVVQSGAADMGLGDRVVIKKMPESMPENPYDNFQEPASLGTDRGRWSSKKMSALRWRLDLINNELSEGIEKVIWMDISTLIASDMSCLYEKLSHFIYRPEVSKNVTRLGVDVAGRLFENITKSQHLVYDDLFMADKTLVDDMMEAERELSDKNAVGTKGLTSYLGMISQKEATGKRKLNDLMDETDKCWGYQYRNKQGVWIEEHHSESSKDGGKALMCTLSCKPVGAMSFDWQSFQILRWHPCTIFRGHDNGPFSWFNDRFATAYMYLVKSCKNDRAKKPLRPCMSPSEASKMVRLRLSQLSDPLDLDVRKPSEGAERSDVVLEKRGHRAIAGGGLLPGNRGKDLKATRSTNSTKQQAFSRGLMQNTTTGNFATNALQRYVKLKNKNKVEE